MRKCVIQSSTLIAFGPWIIRGYVAQTACNIRSNRISTDGTNASSIQFEAGNSNHLYGLSGTVQPAGIYGLLLLKAY